MPPVVVTTADMDKPSDPRSISQSPKVPTTKHTCTITYKWIILALFVDDLKYMPSLDALRTKFYNFLASRLPNLVKYLGRCNEYIGITYHRDTLNGQRRLHLSQQQFAKKVVNDFMSTNDHPANFPAHKGIQDLSTPTTPLSPDEITMFQKRVGSAMFLSNGTWPTIQHTTNSLCSHMHSMSRDALDASQHLIRFIARDPAQGMLYTAKGPGKDLNFEPATNGTFFTLHHFFLLFPATLNQGMFFHHLLPCKL